MNALIQPRITLEAYLAWENEQVGKHEFHRGEVFAMTGGRRVHGFVVLNLGATLRSLLKGTPCRALIENMKVQIGEDTVLYPDVFVTCDKADLATDMIFRSPTLVAEVLSPSTQAYDRSQKFALYRRLPSLREYLLIDPDTRRVEAFRRTANNQWVLHDMSDDAEVELASVGCRIAMSELFADVDAAASPAAES
jgi:Uma2 family endonuclease